MKNTLRVSAFCILLTASIGLRASPNLMYSPFSVVFEKAVWENKSVRVCFAHPAQFAMTEIEGAAPDEIPDLYKTSSFMEVPETIRAEIKNLVTSEFKLKRVGLEFVGWETCTESAKESDAIILVGAEKFSPPGVSGYSAIARTLTEESRYTVEDRTKKPYVFLKHPKAILEDDYSNERTVDAQGFFQSIVLHEFGHLSGLAHENQLISKDNLDGNCEHDMDAYPEYKVAEKQELLEESQTQVVSVYDPNSIMSYCMYNVMQKSTGMNFILDKTLSPNDAESPTADRRLPPNAISLLDPLVYKATKLSKTQTRIQLQVRLSLGDIHALRCLHGFYPEEKKKKICQPKFDPRKDPEYLKLK